MLGAAGTLAIEDLAGRLLSTKALQRKVGSETLMLTDFASGVYGVVLREEGRIMQQQRLAGR